MYNFKKSGKHTRNVLQRLIPKLDCKIRTKNFLDMQNCCTLCQKYSFEIALWAKLRAT